MRIALFLIILLNIQCESNNNVTDTKKIQTPTEPSLPVTEKVQPDSITQEIPIANTFDYPVGKPNARGYYNAQKFGENNHLGDDWNATTGGNSDLGDPIYAIANGKIIKAKNEGGGWGNVVIIRHKLPSGKEIESLYAHCERIDVRVNEIVEKGHQIGTIGNANGIYLAHLHFEIRDQIGMAVGGGYAKDTFGYVDPTIFIEKHRVIK